MISPVGDDWFSHEKLLDPQVMTPLRQRPAGHAKNAARAAHSQAQSIHQHRLGAAQKGANSPRVWRSGSEDEAVTMSHHTIRDEVPVWTATVRTYASPARTKRTFTLSWSEPDGIVHPGIGQPGSCDGVGWCPVLNRPDDPCNGRCDTKRLAGTLDGTRTGGGTAHQGSSAEHVQYPHIAITTGQAAPPHREREPGP